MNARLVVPFVLSLLVLFAAPTVVASPCDCTPPGCGCACECTYSGVTHCSVSQTCQSNQSADCSCTASGCTSSCSTNTNQGISAFSILFGLEMTSGNLVTLGGYVHAMDSDWSFMLEEGLAAGAPLTRDYVWEDGVSFETALNDVASDFSACAEVDWSGETVTFRASGNCS